MEVCLLHPPHYNSSDDRLDPPMGLLYLATHIRDAGHDVVVCDLSGKTEEEWDIPVADVYGLTVYVSSLSDSRKIANKCRTINPKAKIVVGGAHPSACPDDHDFADHVVIGYGEQVIVDLINGKALDSVRNITSVPVDSLFKFPAYDLIDINSYHRKIHDKHYFPYLTSRGCPFSCSFCGLAAMHKINGGVKMADGNLVVEHLTRIKNEFGIDRIAFQDDIFTLKGKRLDIILKGIKDLGMRFRCMGRAGYDTEYTYQQLSEAGCDQVSWGIESGSQHILDSMRKNVKVQDNHNVIQWAKKYNINSRSFFIIGFPGETRDTIEETKQFIINSDPDQYFISNFIPYPGTDVWNNPRAYGIIDIIKDYSQFYQVSKDGTGGITIDTKWLSKSELKELESEFRSWLRINKPFRGERQLYER